MEKESRESEDIFGARLIFPYKSQKESLDDEDKKDAETDRTKINLMR